MPPENVNRLYEAVRDVPDFPKQGIVFKDITPLMLDPDLLNIAIELMAEPIRDIGVDRILAIESRGFLFGAPLAAQLGIGLVLARKPGKLPWKTRKIEYSLEYGTDAIEVHLDAINPGDKVMVIDDLLATGGTASAAASAVIEAGGTLAGYGFVIELSFLNGRERLPAAPVHSLLSYPRED